jgi:hypothetical protein
MMTDGRNFKIGKAKDVEKRKSSLQTGNAAKIKTIAKGYYLNALMAESIFHRALKKYKKSGEWFSLPDEVKHQIVSLLSNQALPEYEDIKFEGLISKTKCCGNRGYYGGYCFGCGKRVINQKQKIYE